MYHDNTNIKKTKITYSYSTIENKNVEKIKMSKRSSQILNWKGMNYGKISSALNYEKFAQK